MSVTEKIKESPGQDVVWVMLSQVDLSKDDGEGKCGGIMGS